MTWWIGSAYARVPLTKEQICGLYRVDADGINGRMSELKALQLVHHDPDQSTYTLNLTAAAHVLNNGGRLDDKFAQLLKHDTVLADAVTVRQRPPY